MGGATGALGNAVGGASVLATLRDSGRISDPQYETVLRAAQRDGLRAEEALITTGVLTEAQLLKLLAGLHRTRFVSSERLAQARVNAKTLAMVPEAIAQKHQVFPVLFEEKSRTLSVVVAAPGEARIEALVQQASGARTVAAYVARPSSIAAAITRHYRPKSGTYRDPFDAIPLDGIPFETQPTGSRGALSPAASAAASVPGATVVSAAPPPPAALELFSGPMAFGQGPPSQRPERPERRARSAAPPAAAAPSVQPPQAEAPPGIDREGYLETLNTFVSLLERERGELRGHSAQVARLCRRAAERLGLSADDTHGLLVAAYLHDIGKTTGGYHLTLLNVAKFDGHRTRAEKTRTTALKLFASASLPRATRTILEHFYERFDGHGFPARLVGKDIPYGARLLAVVETYADLIYNPQNPYRRVLSIPEAIAVLGKLGGSLFDPTLTELLKHVVLGPQTSDSGMQPSALLVDPDPEETTVLEMRLLEQGFAVKVVRDAAAAQTAIADSRPDVVVAEVELGPGADGFSLLGGEVQAGRAPPTLIFLTRRADREAVARGFALGAVDYLVKPTSAEVVATKAAQALKAARTPKGGAGVSGSLKEMALPDVVQILANGRKTGRLRIAGGEQQGEIHFRDGQIWAAQFGQLIGDEAVYGMLKLAEGSFSLDPTFVPDERVIEVSAEGLLLEGMRRLDEGI